jgi:hypothetical protein
MDNFLLFIDSLSQLTISYQLCLSAYDNIDYDKILKSKKIPYKIIYSQDHSFSISKGKNLAYTLVDGDIVFFIDIDMMFKPEVINEICSQVKKGTCFFPIIYRWFCKLDIFSDPNKRFGQWAEQCFGINVYQKQDCDYITKEIGFIGPWNEAYIKWGWEDVDLFNRSKSILNIIRCNVEMFHTWHINENEKKDLML